MIGNRSTSPAHILKLQYSRRKLLEMIIISKYKRAEQTLFFFTECLSSLSFEESLLQKRKLDLI